MVNAFEIVDLMVNEPSPANRYQLSLLLKQALYNGQKWQDSGDYGQAADNSDDRRLRIFARLNESNVDITNVVAVWDVATKHHSNFVRSKMEPFVGNPATRIRRTAERELKLAKTLANSAG